MKLSIIIPTYNSASVLPKALDSIVCQTFTDWECILVDDGSPDRSGKICDEYAEKDKRFRVFHQENAGVSAARNKGLDEAKGEYVNFVDSDDWVETNALEEYISHMSDDVDFVVSGFQNIIPIFILIWLMNTHIVPLLAKTDVNFLSP